MIKGDYCKDCIYYALDNRCSHGEVKGDDYRNPEDYACENFKYAKHYDAESDEWI